MNRSILFAAKVSSAVVLVIGCGNKSETSSKSKDDAASGPAAAPLAMPALGVDQIKRFNFLYEAGAPAHEKAVAAYRKKDWAAVRTQAEAALAKDPTHLGSHRLLAAALAQTGEPAAAVDHLVTAIAADYLAYAPTLDEDDLKSFLASPHGQAVKALAARVHDEYARRIASSNDLASFVALRIFASRRNAMTAPLPTRSARRRYPKPESTLFRSPIGTRYWASRS